MITVVEFRAKQATGIGICPLINYTPIIFSSKLIWTDWKTPLQIIKCFKNENNQKVSLIRVLLQILYSSMKKKIRQIRLIFDTEK
jgi:hypothetical protein